MSSYRRVPQREGAESGSSDSLDGTLVRSRAERLQDKCVSLVWVVAAYFLARWTNFYTTLWSSDQLNRVLLRIAFMGFGIAVAMILYLTLYLPKVKGLSDSSAWSVYCPKVIPTIGVISIVTYLIFLRALWPVWGFLAPVISGTELMAMVMATNFIPVFGLC